MLVNFSDLAVAYPRQNYDDLFNQIGYTADGAVGSVKDYYLQVSYNTLTVQSTVVEAVTLDHGYAYYGANDIYGDDIRPREMVEEALAKLEARGFDFRTVDGDGDGWVDGLTIIHAGGGEEYSGNDTNYIWSHEWSLISPVTYDGVSMQMYHTEPARRGWDAYPSTQGITRIGVICHENGHFLGLPDLYDYGYDSEGAGNFCLMAGGSWNGDYGTTPAHMSAWCKSSLGWVSPTLISSSGVYSLGQVETNAQVYKLQGSFPSSQYFLVENRQGVGFDAGLPGSLRGVLIWHIDETQTNNNDQTHYMVDLEEASGTQHLELDINAGDDADYFRAGNATVFSESSTPNNLSYARQMLKLNVTNVGTSGASMPVTIALVPSISSISPNTGMGGTIVNITNLAGTAFVEGASVKLIKTGQPDIAATNVMVVSATKITCTFSLAGAAGGTWDVKVINPDEQWAVLSNGFSVIVTEPPIAENVNVSTSLNTPVTITLQATDDGLPNPPGTLIYIITSLPTGGSLSDPNAGSITAVPYTTVGNGNQVIYTPTTGYSGLDSFTFKANDGGTPPYGGDSSQATASIAVDPITVEYPVSAIYDDGYASASTTQNLTYNYLRIGYNSSAGLPYYMSGIRFTNLYIPSSTPIVSARLKIRSYTSFLSGTVYGKIQGEDTDNAADFSGRYISGLVKTTASVNWDHSTAWSANTWYNSPDIAAVVQEIIDRPGWSAGNALAILYSTRLSSNNNRRFSSYDRGTATRKTGSYIH